MLSAHAAAGLTQLACVLGRDLQRAARAAGGPERLWRAGPADLARLVGGEATRTGSVRAARAGVDPEAGMRAVAERGLTMLPLGAPGYPAALTAIFDPPFALFGLGWTPAVAAALAERPVVALVGARNADPSARSFARGLGAALAERGAVVVSGLARGIDAEAHAGALEAGGCTVAVLGCGTDHRYPRSNRGLWDRILRGGGAILSEYWPSTDPAPWRFPARNRIIAGVSHAVVVVRAAARSGALITADFALEQGVPVLAAPGAPWDQGAEGVNELIRMGAAVCTGAADVVAEVEHPGWRSAPTSAPVTLTGTPGLVYEALRAAPRGADELAQAVGCDAAGVAAALAMLEIEGLAVRGEGRRWWATARPG